MLEEHSKCRFIKFHFMAKQLKIEVSARRDFYS